MAQLVKANRAENIPVLSGRLVDSSFAFDKNLSVFIKTSFINFIPE